MFLRVLISIFVIVLLYVGARAVVRPFVIQSSAVSPSLKQGETLILERDQVMLGKLPQRFDVIAIVPPYLRGIPIKAPVGFGNMITDLTGLPVAPQPPVDLRRVIALPGETVVIRKGIGIFINGKLLEETSYTKDKPVDDVVVLADIMQQSAKAGEVYEQGTAPIVVPPEHLFLMPDDRKQYAGSDTWGFVDSTYVVGKAVWRLEKNGLKPVELPKLVYATEKIAVNDDGVRALEKGDYTKAIQCFKSALSMDPNFELARENLSIAYNNHAIQSIATPEVSMNSLEKALYLDPNNTLTRKNLAGLLKRMGKDPNKYEDRLELAEKAQKNGKDISALVEFREVLKIKASAAILAKVSLLEKQCNYPPYAIPEEEVSAPAEHTIASAAPAAEKPSKESITADHPVEVAAPEKTTEVSTAGGENKKEVLAPESKKTAKKTSHPTESIAHEEVRTELPERISESATLDAVKTATDSAKHKPAEKPGKNEDVPKQSPGTSDRVAEKREKKLESVEKPESENQKNKEAKKAIEKPVKKGSEKVASDKAVEKPTKKESEKIESREPEAVAEKTGKKHAEKVAAKPEKESVKSKEKPTVDEKPVEEPKIKVASKPVESKQSTSGQIDIGAIFHNIVSGFSAIGKPGTNTNTPANPDHFGPPLLNKAKQASLDERPLPARKSGAEDLMNINP